MPPQISRLSINQATTRPQWNLRQAIEGYARAGVRGIGIWPDKLAELGPAKAVRLLSDHGMTATSLCRGGILSARDRRVLKRQVNQFRQDLDHAAELAASCFIVVSGTVADRSDALPDARRRFAEGLAEVLPHARSVGVPLAVEPIHPMRAGDLCCINTLGQALDICDALGDGIGVAVDAYHVWWDPDLKDQIRRAEGRILAFQLSDWLASTESLVNDRGMMGDGLVDLPALRNAVEAAGFDGFCEVEIMSERNWWRRDPDEVVETCRNRFVDCC